MKETTITIKHTILIDKPRELVWDYTQNYQYRTQWDTSVLEATVLQTTPNRIVKLLTKGNTIMVLIYKQDERPYKTSLVAREVFSPLIESAGGSWVYEEQNGKTLWQQTNTIIFKKTFAVKLALPLFKIIFSRQTKQAMKKAKHKIEKLQSLPFSG